MSDLGALHSSSLADSELSNLRFVMAPQVTFSEQHHRGEIWVIIQNTVSNKHFSTTPLVRDFVEQFKEVRALSEVIQKFPGCSQLSSEEWLDLLSKLMSADILSSPDMDHDEYRLKAHLEQEGKTKKSKWSRPWMIKIPLGNPNVLLNMISSSTRFLWTVPVFIVWVLFVTLGAVETLNNFSALQNFWSTRFLDPTNVLLALLIYPILKFFHELGHGLAAKNWGADVVEIGVLLILFVPLPYIDVSQSSFFPKKHQRMFVAAAGMMFELSIAVGALMVWLFTDSILLQDICMNIILIGAVSSIFFNANPLLKFDGYYLLSDFLEIPNLSVRAVQMCKYTLYNKVFRLPVKLVAHSLAEARWLCSYGVLSQVYRLMISFYIALYLGSEYFFIGVALAIWLLVTQVIKPWLSGAVSLFEDAKEHSAIKRVSAVLASVGLATLIILFVIPFQLNRTFSGVLMLDGQAQVQSLANGFVEEILVEHSAPVIKGQALFHLKNTTIESELLYLESKINESETLENLFSADDPAQAAYHKDQVSAYRQEWENLKQEQSSMIVRSPIKGFFQRTSLSNSLGRYVSKGDHLGDVISSSHTSVVLMLTEEEMKKVDQFESAEVVLPTQPGIVVAVVGVQAIPRATEQLPSPYLGTLYGGDIAVDSSKSSGLQLLKPMFHVNVSVHVLGSVLIGTRAQVKLRADGDPIGILAINTFTAALRDRGIL